MVQSRPLQNSQTDVATGPYRGRSRPRTGPAEEPARQRSKECFPMSALPTPILAPEVEEAPVCQHHWLIDTPAGSVTRGVCRKCGAIKEYPSAWNGGVWDQEEVKEPVFRRWSNSLED